MNKIDNLFVVESPLQALVAVELSLKFREKKNGVVYRLSADRERNNQQIKNVIKKGCWNLVKEISIEEKKGIFSHFAIRKMLNNLRNELSGNVNQLFIGEFRSQWMHFMRSAVRPSRTILIDDGTATLASKRKFIDNEVFFPSSLWKGNSLLKETVKRIIYHSFLSYDGLNTPVLIASAFLKSDSVYPIDFSEIKKIFSSNSVLNQEESVFFFGSKYSEAEIVSLEYELQFLQSVKNFYSDSGLKIIYCAHRDESISKLKVIGSDLGFEVISPDMPAEVFLLEQNDRVTEVAGAYSSVLNNIKGLLPEASIRAFRLKPEEINIKNRDDIEKIYDHFKKEGVHIELDEKHICQ